MLSCIVYRRFRQQLPFKHGAVEQITSCCNIGRYFFYNSI
jgi:hypothetical protein